MFEIFVAEKVFCVAAQNLAAFFLDSGSLGKKTVDDEQQNRANRCNEDAADIEGLNLSEADETAQKAAQDAADYADEDRDEKATGILARQEEFGEGTRDQT